MCAVARGAGACCGLWSSLYAQTLALTNKSQSPTRQDTTTRGALGRAATRHIGHRGSPRSGHASRQLVTGARVGTLTVTAMCATMYNGQSMRAHCNAPTSHDKETANRATPVAVPSLLLRLCVSQHTASTGREFEVRADATRTRDVLYVYHT